MKKLFTLLVCVVTASFCQAQMPELELQEFSTGYVAPLGIENAGDDRLFILEKAGRVWIAFSDGSKSNTPFLNIVSKIKSAGSEQGLLGLAFHPDYASNGYFYVTYTNLSGNVVIARYSVSSMNENIANSNSESIMLMIYHPWPNHNGGCTKFGPDGYLYVGVGDGGRAGDPLEAAQDKSVLLGKILRLDVDNGLPYSIPASNPFVNTPGAAPEIWAYGLRNPWRFSFDRKSGDLWIGDVGQVKWEEVDYQKASSTGGENYGWDCYEGHHLYEPENCTQNEMITSPIAEYSHDGGDCSITGGFVYRGSQFPNLKGKYLYVDYCSGIFRAVYKQNGITITNVELLDGVDFQYSSFGEDKNGELYVATVNPGGGRIYRVVDKSMKLGTATANLVSLYPNPNNGQFSVEWSSMLDKDCDIEIMNMMGQQMMSETRSATIGLNTWSFNTNQLSPGSYFLVIHTTDGLVRQKFAIE
jgi:glucose/arabinose dehydrogenase